MLSGDIDPSDSVSQTESSFVGGSNRSILSVPSQLRDITELAGEIIMDYTLFQDPLPDAQETLRLIDSAWRQAQNDLKKVGHMVKTAENWVNFFLG